MILTVCQYTRPARDPMLGERAKSAALYWMMQKPVLFPVQSRGMMGSGCLPPTNLLLEATTSVTLIDSLTLALYNRKLLHLYHHVLLRQLERSHLWNHSCVIQKSLLSLGCLSQECPLLLLLLYRSLLLFALSYMEDL